MRNQTKTTKTPDKNYIQIETTVHIPRLTNTWKGSKEDWKNHELQVATFKLPNQRLKGMSYKLYIITNIWSLQHK